jgi:hypothetical protein
MRHQLHFVGMLGWAMVENHQTLAAFLLDFEEVRPYQVLNTDWQYLDDPHMQARASLSVPFERWRKRRPLVIYVPTPDDPYDLLFTTSYGAREIQIDHFVDAFGRGPNLSPAWLLKRLFYCCRHGHLEILKLWLLSAEAEKSFLDHLPSLKRALLIEAATSGQLQIVELLYESCVNYINNLAVKFSDTLLPKSMMELARFCGHSEILDFLTARGH